MKCANCGAGNADDARFCNNCGSALVESAPQVEERRFLTVLFADLVGFTAESDGADPEDVRALLTPYHRRIRHEIERFGGTIEKLIGDGVMAVFGVPIAHEDDPERAVRAALQIQQAVNDLDEGHPDLRFSVRIGINSGEAIVTHAGDTEKIVGDMVNTASRLESIAPPGGVVVGESTHRATKLLITYEELPPVEVKGKSEALLVWRAVEPIGKYGVDAVVRPDTPFLGRESELGTLTETFRRVIADSAIRLVTVTGPPGVGKTRLVNEFSNWVDDEPEVVWWRQGRCLPYGEGISFWALGEIVKAQSGIRESDAPAVAAEKLAVALEAIIADPTDREWLAAQLAPLVGATTSGGAGTEQSEAFAAWRRFLDELAASGPLVVVIEDLHWADDALMDFLDDLLVWSADVPIMVICTARPELYEEHPGWGGGHRNSTTISLGPLSDEDISRLISALLDQAALPAETQQVLLDRASGTPLYAEEFVRMLHDRDALQGHGRLSTPEESPIPVPETVQAVIGARLDVLSDTERAVLQDASVVGKVFWEGALLAVSDYSSTLSGSLRQLIAREWIRPVRSSSVEGQNEYAFWHLLTRDVAYGRIPRAARAQKHQAVAQWIEELAGDRVTDHAELLAHHYLNALEIAEATGKTELIGDLQAEAARSLVMAGDRNMRLHVGKAHQHYQRGLDLMDPGDEAYPAVLVKAGDAMAMTGVSSPGEAYRQAIIAFRERGDDVETAGALIKLGVAQWHRGGADTAIAATEEAIELLERHAPHPYLARAYNARAAWHMMQGRLEEHLAWSNRGLEVATEFELEEEKSRALSLRGIARFELGEVAEGLDDLRESVRIAEESSISSERLLSGFANLGDFTWAELGSAAGQGIYERGIRLLEKRGASASWVKVQTTWTLFDLGRWDDLITVTDDLLTDHSAAGQIETWARVYRAKVFAWRGRLGEAADLAAQFLPAAREIGDLQVLSPALVTAGMIKVRRGDSKSAVELISDFRVATEGRTPAYRALQVAEAVRTLAEAGEIAGALQLLSGTSSGTRGINSDAAAEAAAAEAKGEFLPALSQYQHLALAWADFGHVLETALAHYGAGRCLIGLGRADEAQHPLMEARQILVDLGAIPTVAEIDNLLEEAAAI